MAGGKGERDAEVGRGRRRRRIRKRDGRLMIRLRMNVERLVVNCGKEEERDREARGICVLKIEAVS